ncbi:MAG: cytochrome c oxidase subunit II [Pyrinomonadaceae bacterium]
MQDKFWFHIFPEQASSFAWNVDALFTYILTITLIFGIGTAIVITIFALKYKEREKYAHPHGLHGSVVVEATWTFIPFVIAMTIFVFGAFVYYKQYRPPANSMEIYVVGKQWMWKFQHGTGQREINELHVPAGQNIKLVMTTEDVIHDVFIPAFRTKADVVPGRYTYVWFNATKPGKYHLFCAEYCGLNHSGMTGWVYVMEKRDYQNWLAGNNTDQTPEQAGEDLFKNKLGCASCHTGGSDQRGPNLDNIVGKEVKFVGGGTQTVDDAYIRDSILNPAGHVVEGFQPIMPTFKGQVTEEQLVALVAYIKSLSGGAASTTGATTVAPAQTAAQTSAPAKAQATPKSEVKK